ncbi:Peptidyl-prolyl cis-trans isomerase (rotamase)-cyclophilin family [Robiginitalea myxolifaciens]|uniref:Peptidyl-prolyl cis-trans isomerase n=1 Tax=Robiginitalea myxolifaciens TaxID=400055 RepID=A0A1I6H4J3_9FLAO|nr:peptidylprolyl isomerase [Robiginitalea myxolifaciens]SFR49385.1 Peptidyl-prolyl cis-trans isomerase (rotamase)-cyclophilin family [Robiginitalea myxolifaciens]
MIKIRSALFLSFIFFASLGCGEQNKEKESNEAVESLARDSATAIEDGLEVTAVESDSTAEEEAFVLNEDNAIDFFFDYQKELKVNKVRIKTTMGDFTIELFDNVPYHKSNFIYLTRQGYFDSTMFHRVVRNFIIQGGNADNKETARKRTEIGRYLLPPDTRKGHRHHRGTVSMPSSEIDNPHMLASPYEFFIVVTNPGSYHLDGEYTAFGQVVSGMDVVDAINQVETDSGEWPMQNVYILKAEVLE